jgi:hypothetical protein
MSQVKERSMWSLIGNALGLTSGPKSRGGRDRLKGPPRARPPQRVRPEVEALETRTLLSTGFEATVARTLPHVFASETSRTVTDAGGPVITNVDVDLVFWGSGWLTYGTLMNNVTNSVQTIMNSPYLSGLAQYRGIGNGRLLRADTIVSTDPAANTTDSQFDAFVQANINNGSLPVTPNMDSQILYVVIPQPGTTDPQEGYGGAHGTDSSNFGRFHYGWTEDISNLDDISVIYSHELVEAVTDPEVNYADAFHVPSTNDEISDGTAQSYKYRLNGVLVQSYLSQQDQAYIGPWQWEDTFVVGQNGAINDTVQLNGSFAFQYQLAPAGSATPTGGITAVSRSPDTMEVWWIGQNGSVQDKYYFEGAGWNGFQLAPAGSASTKGGIAAVSRNPDAMEVWWIGANGSVQDKWFYSGLGWNGFQLAPAGSASTTGGIAAVSRNSDAMEVWWIGANGSVQDKWFYSGLGWNGFQLAPAGSASTTGGIAAVSRNSDAMEVWWVGADGSVQDGWFYSGLGWNRFQLAPAGSASTTGGIGAFSRDPDIMEVWWIGPDGALHKAQFDETGWH